MTKAFTLFLILIFQLALPIASHGAAKVRVGLYQNSPKIFTNEGGKATGFYIDLLEAIAAKESWSLDYVPCDWSQCLAQLAGGQIDLLPDVAYSDERAQRFDFNQHTVLSNWATVYTKLDAQIESFAGFKDKKIAFLRDDITLKQFDSSISPYGIEYVTIEAESYSGVFEQVQRGTADAGLVNHLFGKRNADAFDLIESPIVCCPRELRFAATRDKHATLISAIDRQLNSLRQDRGSAYYRAVERWIENKATTILPRWLIITLVTIVVLVCALIIIAAALRSRVEARTSELSAANLKLNDEIAERKQSELQLQRLNRFFSALSATNEAIVRATDVNTLYQQVCEIATRDAGFLLAWIGIANGESISATAVAGQAQGYLDNLQISSRADLPHGRNPADLVFRSGEYFICNDFLHDAALSPWADKASRFGIKASAVFPLEKAGEVVAILNIYAGEDNIFQQEEVNLLQEMAQDISFSLDHLQQQAELRLAMASLQQAKQELEERVQQRTAQLEVAKVRAETADKFKSAFLATMSHELRTPLNSIIGFTGVLLQQLPGPLNPEQVKQMTMVRNSSRHVLSLINDVLDISKVEAGELKLTQEQFDLAELLTRTVDSFTTAAELRGLSLTRNFNSNHIEIKGDSRRIEQVLNNLLSNALKCTHKGTITLDCSQVDDYLVILVSDTGTGIKTEDMGDLFLPFRQIKNSPLDAQEGTGLGLAISKHLVEAMSGKLYAESVWGEGSRFYFTLPIGMHQ